MHAELETEAVGKQMEEGEDLLSIELKTEGFFFKAISYVHDSRSG